MGTPLGTLWRRALRRVDRRALRYVTVPTEDNRRLLAEACDTANAIFRLWGR